MDKIELLDKYMEDIELCRSNYDKAKAERIVTDIVTVFCDEIPNIKLGLNMGRINYDNLGGDYHDDLRILKLKLEMLRTNIEFDENKEKRKLEELSLQKSILTINNTNSNTLHLNITFEETRDKIKAMTSLNDSEIEEILKKVDMLEKIIKSKERKNQKWGDAKEIIKWIADKGFDVGIAFLPLLLQIQ